MSITMPDVTDTRARMIRAYRSGLEALIEDATQRPGDVVDEATGELAMNLGDWDGVPVVTRKRLDEAISAIFGQSIPAPSETTVEVSTPASVLVSAICPRCDTAQLILMSVHPELLIDDEGSELRVKAKSKGVSHTCGQLPLSVVDDEDEVREQAGLMEAIESLTARVHGMLTRIIETDEDHAPPSLEDVAEWDRATIDQVDAWATARLAQIEDPSDPALVDAVPPLPRVLGGEADPEPVDGEPAPDVFEDDEPTVDEIADMEGMAEPHPEDKGNGAFEEPEEDPRPTCDVLYIDGAAERTCNLVEGHAGDHSDLPF